MTFLEKEISINDIGSEVKNSGRCSVWCCDGLRFSLNVRIEIFLPENMSLAVFELLNYTENSPADQEKTRDVGENNLTEAKRIIKLRKLCQYENAGKSFHYFLNFQGLKRNINRLAWDDVKSHSGDGWQVICLSSMPLSLSHVLSLS